VVDKRKFYNRAKNQFAAQQHKKSQLTTMSTKQILHTVIPRQKLILFFLN